MNDILHQLMTWDLRWIPVKLMLLAGSALFVRGIVQCVRGAMTPNGTPGKNLTWMRGFRGFIQGGSIAAAGVGWWFGWPVMIAAAAIIILEETIETSIATWALRQEFEADSTSAPSSARR